MILYAILVMYNKFIVVVECWKLVFDNTGRKIYTAGELGLITIFDSETGEVIETLKTSEIFATTIAIVLIKILFGKISKFYLFFNFFLFSFLNNIIKHQ